jgi:putative ABC transport system permease protein
MLSVGSYRPNYLCVKVLEVDIRRSQEFLENYFSENGRKPKVSFLNQRFEQWVKYQDQLNNISIVLTTVALIVSCCAIYALTISFVRDNLKQIAIHKLCGANNLNLTRILTREFAFQTLLVALLAGPLAYLVIKELLREFVYATQVTLLNFTYPLVFVVLTVIILSALQVVTLNRNDLSSSLKA